jgi:hypothetical protein
MNDTHHPGRSTELLSRLHDGEITDAERRAFDEHCAACPACRAAAEDYERTLSLYREAPLAPTPSDLSARILRKVRAQSPSRRPLHAAFGIDLRWAGALLAALLVILVSAPLLLRREIPPSGPAPSSSISARLLENASPAAEAPGAPTTQRRDDAREPSRLAGRAQPAPAPVAKARPPLPEAEAPRPAAPPAQARARTEANEPLSKDEAAAMPPRPREIGSGLAAHKNASADSAEAKVQAAEETAAVRLVVRPLEGEGGVLPEILARPPDERLRPFRGREFLLTVDPTGAVSEVSPAPGERDSALRQLGPQSAPAAADAFRELRFEAGGRTLRLLVRVD